MMGLKCGMIDFYAAPRFIKERKPTPVGMIMGASPNFIKCCAHGLSSCWCQLRCLTPLSAMLRDARRSAVLCNAFTAHAVRCVHASTG